MYNGDEDLPGRRVGDDGWVEDILGVVSWSCKHFSAVGVTYLFSIMKEDHDLDIRDESGIRVVHAFPSHGPM